MFCKECGKQLKDGAKFCDECGTPIENDSLKLQSAAASNNWQQNTASNNYSGDQQSNGVTRYASTAFKFSLFGLLCWLCCGLQLLAGIPAIIFAILAIKKQEAEVEKAYIALGIGVLDVIIFIIFMAVGARS